MSTTGRSCPVRAGTGRKGRERKRRAGKRKREQGRQGGGGISLERFPKGRQERGGGGGQRGDPSVTCRAMLSRSVRHRTNLSARRSTCPSCLFWSSPARALWSKSFPCEADCPRLPSQRFRLDVESCSSSNRCRQRGGGERGG